MPRTTEDGGGGRSYADAMWDILTWHNGTLSIAWWALIVLFVLASIIGGSKAARR